jgi:hypothetical protein
MRIMSNLKRSGLSMEPTFCILDGKSRTLYTEWFKPVASGKNI